MDFSGMKEETQDTGNEDMGVSASVRSDHEDFQDAIVRRTNALFVKLNITTRPIQAFEELQKSASSMFVAIFETLFNVRLKNVIRKPRVVTDYITNAELVMTALSEALPIDLSSLSGEQIYRGDPIQIHQMLNIFENLWTQLFQASDDEPEKNKSTAMGISSGRSSTPFHWEDDTTNVQKEPSSLPKRRVKKVKTVSRRRGKKTAKRSSTSKENEPDLFRVVDARRNYNSETKTRKKNEAGKPPTKGQKALKKSTKNARKFLTADENSRANVRRETEIQSLAALANRYPSIYHKITATRQPKISTRKGLTSGSLSAVMESDLERYQKAYDLMVKDIKADLRAKAQQEKRDAQIAIRSRDLDFRIQAAQSTLAAKELNNREKSRQLERETKEEVHIRKLFQSALKLEREAALEMRRMNKDRQDVIDRQRINHYESLKRYYQDRKALLQEKLENEARHNKISRHERDVALRQIESNLRAEYKASVDQMTSEWAFRDQQEKSLTEEDLSQMFESWNKELSKSLNQV